MNSPDHRWIRAKEIHKKFENRFPVDSTALIINFEYTELEWLMIAGGAANVVNNAATLGGTAYAAGVCGTDTR